MADRLNVSANYFNHDEGYDTINGSIGTDVGKLELKLEANYVTTDTKNPGASDDSAATYAVYAGHKCTDKFKLLVRAEVVDDNNSGIYGYDGSNFAVTPTYNPTENSFIKVVGVYAIDDNKVFADDEGVPMQEDTRSALIVEFGILF